MLQGHVLLAEDSPDNQLLVKCYVNQLGLEITVVENGKLACDKARQEEFDLILMDLQMPVMDGLEAVKQLRSRGYSKPIIMLTANAMKSELDRCINAGASDYVTKPIDLKRFYAVIRKYISSSQVLKPENKLVQDAALANVDPILRDLAQTFLDSLPQQLDELLEASHKEQWVKVEQIAHGIKGSGGNFGFDRFTSLGLQIQQFYLANDFTSMSTSVKEFYQYGQSILDNYTSSSKSTESNII